MPQFVYPVTVTPDPQDGGFVVQLVDFPEAITQGETLPEALHEAADCLEEAVANRIALNLPLPVPSGFAKEGYRVTLPVQMAAKAALYLAMQEVGVTNVELAQRLGYDEKEVRRLLDPHHASKIPRIETALQAVGKQLVIGVQPAI
jgi:antitoxin HicB